MRSRDFGKKGDPELLVASDSISEDVVVEVKGRIMIDFVQLGNEV